MHFNNEKIELKTTTVPLFSCYHCYIVPVFISRAHITGKSFSRKISNFFNHECFLVTNPASIHCVGGLELNIYNGSFLRHILR